MVKLFFCTIMQFSVHIDYLTKDLKEIEPLSYNLTFMCQGKQNCNFSG